MDEKKLFENFQLTFGRMISPFEIEDIQKWIHEDNMPIEVQLASFLPEEAYNIQKEKIDNLAETLGCDVVVIEASYDLKFIDGEDVPELTKEQKVKSMVNGMFEQVFGGE